MPKLQFKALFNELNSEEKWLWGEWKGKLLGTNTDSVGLLVCFLCINNARIKAYRSEEDFYILLQLCVNNTSKEELEKLATGYIADEGDANPLFYSICYGKDEEAVRIVSGKTPKGGFNQIIKYLSPSNLCVSSLLDAAIFSRFIGPELVAKILANTLELEVIERAYTLLKTSDPTWHQFSDENKSKVMKSLESRIRWLKVYRRASSLRKAVSNMSPKPSRSASKSPLGERLLPNG